MPFQSIQDSMLAAISEKVAEVIEAFWPFWPLSPQHHHLYQ